MNRLVLSKWIRHKRKFFFDILIAIVSSFILISSAILCQSVSEFCNQMQGFNGAWDYSVSAPSAWLQAEEAGDEVAKSVMLSAELNHEAVMVESVDHPERLFPQIREGRYPEKPDEMMVTASLAILYDLHSGDRVNLSVNGEELSMIICGIVQDYQSTAIIPWMNQEDAMITRWYLMHDNETFETVQRILGMEANINYQVEAYRFGRFSKWKYLSSFMLLAAWIFTACSLCAMFTLRRIHDRSEDEILLNMGACQRWLSSFQRNRLLFPSIAGVLLAELIAAGMWKAVLNQLHQSLVFSSISRTLVFFSFPWNGIDYLFWMLILLLTASLAWWVSLRLALLIQQEKMKLIIPAIIRFAGSWMIRPVIQNPFCILAGLVEVSSMIVLLLSVFTLQTFTTTENLLTDLPALEATVQITVKDQKQFEDLITQINQEEQENPPSWKITPVAYYSNQPMFSDNLEKKAELLMWDEQIYMHPVEIVSGQMFSSAFPEMNLPVLLQPSQEEDILSVENDQKIWLIEETAVPDDLGSNSFFHGIQSEVGYQIIKESGFRFLNPDRANVLVMNPEMYQKAFQEMIQFTATLSMEWNQLNGMAEEELAQEMVNQLKEYEPQNLSLSLPQADQQNVVNKNTALKMLLSFSVCALLICSSLCQWGLIHQFFINQEKEWNIFIHAGASEQFLKRFCRTQIVGMNLISLIIVVLLLLFLSWIDPEGFTWIISLSLSAGCWIGWIVLEIKTAFSLSRKCFRNYS